MSGGEDRLGPVSASLKYDLCARINLTHLSSIGQAAVGTRKICHYRLDDAALCGLSATVVEKGAPTLTEPTGNIMPKGSLCPYALSLLTERC